MWFRLPFGRRSFAGLVVLVCVCTPQSAAVGQSIFSDLFGFTVAPQKPGGDINVVPQNSTSSPVRNSGRYRTLCVRMCDGYYFPISHSASRSSFYKEAQRCQARCPGQARLFYTSSGARDVKWATDVSGLTYKNLDTAFLYRKKLVKNCSCRPAPWSPEERARHHMYQTEKTEIAALSKGEPGIGELSSAELQPPGTGTSQIPVTGVDDGLAPSAVQSEPLGLPQSRPKRRVSANNNNFEAKKQQYNFLKNSSQTSSPSFLWSDGGR